jgi:hypothetical protein
LRIRAPVLFAVDSLGEVTDVKEDRDPLNPHLHEGIRAISGRDPQNRPILYPIRADGSRYPSAVRYFPDRFSVKHPMRTFPENTPVLFWNSYSMVNTPNQQGKIPSLERYTNVTKIEIDTPTLIQSDTGAASPPLLDFLKEKLEFDISIGASDIRPVRMPDTWDTQDFSTYENPPP